MNPVPQPTKGKEIVGAKFLKTGKSEAVKKELCGLILKF